VTVTRSYYYRLARGPGRASDDPCRRLPAGHDAPGPAAPGLSAASALARPVQCSALLGNLNALRPRDSMLHPHGDLLHARVSQGTAAAQMVPGSDQMRFSRMPLLTHLREKEVSRKTLREREDSRDCSHWQAFESFPHRDLCRNTAGNCPIGRRISA
jgi:hypothetical protein